MIQIYLNLKCDVLEQSRLSLENSLDNQEIRYEEHESKKKNKT